MSANHGGSTARSYEESDLKGLKKAELLRLVKTQINCWLLHGKQKKLRQDKVTKRQLVEALLDPRNRFMTTAQRRFVPMPTEPIPWQPALLGNNDIFSQPAPTTHQCDIRLHIHNHRSVLGPSKALKVVHGHAVNHAHLPGMWQVSAGDILQQLQKTNGRIMGPGPVKLSVPDDRELDYTQYFVQASVSKLMSAHTDPDQLTVPASLTTDLTIRVDFAGVAAQSSSGVCVDESVLEDDGHGSKVLLQCSELPSNFKPLEGTHARAKTKKKGQVDEDDVAWLRTSASERFGHECFWRFQRGHNRVLQNSDILALWQFATQFCNAYHHKKSGASGNVITKTHIYAVLDVGETWLRQAEEGHRLVRLYGEGGEHEALEVKEKLAEMREHALGSGKLFKFLHNWEVTHPAM